MLDDFPIGAVVQRVEAGQALVECFRADSGACCFSPGYRLAGALRRAQEVFLEVLDGTELAACLSPLPGPPADPRT
nr:hypothetical protein [Roseomonas rosulenta]